MVRRWSELAKFRAIVARLLAVVLLGFMAARENLP